MVKSELKSLNGGQVSQQVAVYQAMIRALDMGIEQVYNAAQKLDRETIIIFGSDNGATVMALKARVSRTSVRASFRGTAIARCLGNPDCRNFRARWL